MDAVKDTGSKLPIVIFLAMALTGCETDARPWRPARDTAVEQTNTIGRTETAASRHCRQVAAQRSADASANGYSIEQARTVYAGTYQDCLEWDAHHPG